VPRAHEAALQQAARAAGVAVARVGTFSLGPPAVMVRGVDGKPMHFDHSGWSHF
jgi:hypothetical protein